MMGKVEQSEHDGAVVTEDEMRRALNNLVDAHDPAVTGNMNRTILEA